MLIRRKAALAAVVFTALVLVAVNIGWWWHYRSLSTYMERQLSLRLTGIAGSAAMHFDTVEIDGLLIDDLDIYGETFIYLDSLARLESLSEAAIIDIDFNYLVSTRIDLIETSYLLAGLNFDSLQQAAMGQTATSELYDIDGTYLKSAFAPLYDGQGDIVAILLVEAGVGYFNLLKALRQNLSLMAGGSAGMVMILLLFYIVYNRRMAAAEERIFRAESQAALGRMVAVVSHEIKNPLMIIRAAGERIEKKYSDPEASFVVEEVSRLDNIVSGYLSFARGDKAFQSDIRSGEKIDLAALIQKVVDELHSRFTDEGVDLQYIPADSLPNMFGDRIGLRQVMVNLLLNGLQAASEDEKPGVRTVIIRLSVLETGHRRFIIRVQNSGTPIKRSQYERLFEPFYTTRVSGSGLGLYLSRRIVEAHGGTIAISDDIKGLTTFEVILPGEEKT